MLVQVLLHFALGRFGLGQKYESLRMQMVILNVIQVKWFLAASAAILLPGNSLHFSSEGHGQAYFVARHVMISPLVLQALPPVTPNGQRRFGAISLPGGVQTLMLLSRR